MLYDSDVANLKKYRYLIAALIAHSVGYFTPIAAFRAIENHKNNTPYFCEWYTHIASINEFKSDEDYLIINRNVIKDAIKRRHRYNIKHCLEIVDMNISGHESSGASWF